MLAPTADLAHRLRILQLETLYDLALALHANRPEQELVEELMQRVCAVLDPAMALAVTRGVDAAPRALVRVGWRGEMAHDGALDDPRWFDNPLWSELLTHGRTFSRRGGELFGAAFEELLAVPLGDRDSVLGYLVLVDKETRGDAERGFTGDDLRFLDSVAALAGVALGSLRRREELEAQRERLAEENKVLKGRLVEELHGHRIVAHAPPMRQVLQMVERVAPRSVNVLLRGESGTGKELVAKLFHSLSGRSGALIALNCAALPEALLESELFGIEGGVATGVEARRGKFELADGGTLFLDEIGDLQLPLQVKLLRALQEREITKVGSHKAIRVDVRVIAATHRHLEDLILEGHFREDLYYRLKGIEIELPPLRDRRQDIAHLVRHFLESFCEREEIPVPHLTPEAQGLLLAHDYPGNVRELQNLIEGAVSLADDEIDVTLLRGLMGGDADEGAGPLDLASLERRHIERVLKVADGNKSAAARLLGIDRRTLQRKGF